MKILGIDTVFHNVCASIVEDGNNVLSNIIVRLPLRTNMMFDFAIGHIDRIGFVINSAFKKAKCHLDNIDAIAVSNFGSLFSSVSVGVSVANALANINSIPIISVDHRNAHLFSCWVGRDSNIFKFPIVVLSASGAHNSLVFLKKNDFKVVYIATNEGCVENKNIISNFNGIGALYSFVARKLGKNKKEGEIISEMAKRGNNIKFKFKSLERSESEIFNSPFLQKEIISIINKHRNENNKRLSEDFVRDFAASFQNSITNSICGLLIKTAKEKKAKEVHLVGGISANDYLKSKLNLMCLNNRILCRYPVKKNFSTDNAAMTASLAYYLYKQCPGKYKKSRNVKVVSDYKLEYIAIKQYLDSNQELC